MKKLTKEFLGLAGEYAVATELCKRDIYAQLTLGHYKSTDIIIEKDYNLFKIQVKAKQEREWPSISGISRENDFLVLVDFQKKDEKDRPDFYILDIKDWKKLIEDERKDFPELRIDDKLRLTYPDGWKGLNIKPEHIEICKDKWEKITSKCQG